MRCFSTESVFDKDTEEWKELYFINAEEVDADVYFEEMELETEVDEEVTKSNEQIISEYTVEILNSHGCPKSIYAILSELFYEAKDLGYEEAKDEMREYLED